MGHEHHLKEAGGKRLAAALALNLGITLAQVVGGLVSGSLALLSDAVHNGSDAASLGISLFARKISQRRADRRRTFGYHRAEVVGALINLTTLFAIAIFLLYQAATRLFDPPEVESKTMLIVGVIAFVEDAISAYLLYQGAQSSVNIKSAFIHMAGDTLATLGVIVGSLLMMFYGIYIVDPLLTALIAIYIAIAGYREIRRAIAIVMESAPEGFDFDRMVQQVQGVEGVRDLHHVHLWRLDEQRAALEAHVVVDRADLQEIEAIKRRVKDRLQEEFKIAHATLEIEVEGLSDHSRAVIPEA